ncbi:hypothetical protein F9U64_11045 [Gracilibacillus oryzae]|uniref:Lipid-A-disaccharide synthase n=1 Tax=Gracilibacillus oryzae TaxID=1672701 RepID=A0A7C8KZ91_9BACI|nr:hypothetical protein [Gracilibacillus oryzae]KAB8135796.1 hypothetical protein F9U64_11045 [Gracilibacillus oryzae]
MSTFLKNYWSLYYDFIKDFESLKYNGYSLPYLCHLPRYVLHQNRLLNELEGADYSKNIKRNINGPKELQALFNQFVQSHEKKPLTKNQGKTVINMDKLLRFSPETLSKFDPAKTVILSTMSKKKRKKPKIVSNKATVEPLNGVIVNQAGGKKPKPTQKTASNILLPVYPLDKYTSDVKKQVKIIQQQATKMFVKYNDHHIYKDQNFQIWFLQAISDVISCIEMVKKFLQEVKVACIIVPSTHNYKSRILAVVASEAGIPTICMQHGIVSSELGYIPKIATVDAVYGNFEKDMFKKMDVPKNSVEIIGHPRFDQAFKKVSIKTKLDTGKKKSILIALRGAQDDKLWRQFITTIANNKLDLNVFIKNYPSKEPHPLTKEFPFVHSTKKLEIYELFPQVDAVITYSSTVGIEAMLAGKQVFILLEDFRDYSGYYDKLGNLVVKNPIELGNLVTDYFNNTETRRLAENQRKKFLDYIYPVQTSSIDRLNNLINRLTK